MANNLPYPAFNAPLYPTMPFTNVPNTQSVNELRFVQGEAAAKAYNAAPGSKIFLMDSEEPFFYIKTVDFNGVPSPLRKFKYEEIIEAPVQQAQTYVTL